MKRKTDKPTKKLPDWIIVSASDPKLQKAVEDKLVSEIEDRGMGDILEVPESQRCNLEDM